MKNPASTYQRLAIESASPVGLILILYDAALQCLHKAQRAMEANNIEQRVAELNRALSIIGLLQSSLDYQRGGEVAPQLNRMYEFASAKILEASIKASPDILRQLAAQFYSLRQAWEQVERSNVNSVQQPEMSVPHSDAMTSAAANGVSDAHSHA